MLHVGERPGSSEAGGVHEVMEGDGEGRLRSYPRGYFVDLDWTIKLVGVTGCFI